MVFSDIRKAFNIAVGNAGFPIEIAYENVKYEPNVTTPYIQLFLLPVQPEQASLGDSGCDFHTGIFQIDINYAQSEGVTDLDAMADQINTLFKSGTSFTENGLQVRIENVGIGPLVVERGWATLSLSIEYFAYSQRL